MSLEIVSALGPGPHVAELTKSTKSYNVATTNFNELLQYPFLQSIYLSEGEKPDEDLRTIVTDGSSRFSQLCTTNISVAQQVISYGRTVPLLLGALTIGNYATTTQPLVARYAAEAAASSTGNEQFFEEVCFSLFTRKTFQLTALICLQFKVYLVLLDEQIALMERKIADLTKNIEQANNELADANVGRVIGDVIQVFSSLSTSGTAPLTLWHCLGVV
jgi:hypothetical protein